MCPAGAVWCPDLLNALQNHRPCPSPFGMQFGHVQPQAPFRDAFRTSMCARKATQLVDTQDPGSLLPSRFWTWRLNNKTCQKSIRSSHQTFGSVPALLMKASSAMSRPLPGHSKVIRFMTLGWILLTCPSQIYNYVTLNLQCKSSEVIFSSLVQPIHQGSCPAIDFIY